jgi:hypothetical protein
MAEFTRGNRNIGRLGKGSIARPSRVAARVGYNPDRAAVAAGCPASGAHPMLDVTGVGRYDSPWIAESSRAATG